MEIREFADRHRLRVKRDGCGDEIIPAKLGHLYEHSADRFGMLLEDPADRPSRARALLGRRRKALSAGFSLHQAGDAEAILLFDPENPEQTRLAIRLVRAKRRRIASPAQIEAARKGAAAILLRRKHLAAGTSATQNRQNGENAPL